MPNPLLIVVDDEPQITTLVADVGEIAGFETRVANTAAEFKEIIATTNPTVIVMDIVMPDMDGIELLQWLADRGCVAPIVLISGFDPLYLRTARMIGTANGLQFVEPLAKPIRIAQLQAVLGEVIRRGLPPALEQEQSKPNHVETA